MKTLIARIGPLRLVLVGLSIVCMPLAFFAEGEADDLVGILLVYVTPSLVVLFFFVLLLDALMNRVFMIEQAEDERAVRRTRMRVNLLAVLGLVLFWFEYFRTIGTA